MRRSLLVLSVVGATGLIALIGTLGSTGDSCWSCAANSFIHNLLNVIGTSANCLAFHLQNGPENGDEAADVLIYWKWADPDLVWPGETLTYTIDVTNFGPSDAQNVVVSETYPEGFIFGSADPAPDSGTTDRWTLGTLAAGAWVTITITGQVDLNAWGTLTNTVEVTADTYDPNPWNNIAHADAEVMSVDLCIWKRDDPDPVVAGETLTYTIEVWMCGEAASPESPPARNVVVSETYPEGFIFESADPAPDPGTNNRWTFETLATGEWVTITITGRVASNVSGELTNEVSVSSDTHDLNDENNTAIETTQVETSADLSIGKSDNPDSVVAGENLTYTITVINSGPSDAQYVEVIETYPEEFSFISAIPAPTEGTDYWTFETLAAGDSVTITITGQVDLNASGTLTNMVEVYSETDDPIPENNIATETTQVGRPADLSIGKSDNPDPVVAGENLTYTITVINSGPSDAQYVEVIETYPEEFSFISAIPAPTEGTDYWTFETLAAGDSVTITITGQVDLNASGTLTNMVEVYSKTDDPNPWNNIATAETEVMSADLCIWKEDDPDPVVAGETLTYTIEVSMCGEAASPESPPAQNVVVSETYPEGFIFISADPAPDPGTNNCWTFETLAPDETVTIQITGRVASNASGILTNEVSVSSDTHDPNPWNNTAIETTRVNNLVFAEDDRYVTTEDTALTINAPGVLANDFYPDGFGSLAVVESPPHGTLTLNPDGSFTYVPDPQFWGTDSFVYRLCDMDGECDVAAVTIEIVFVNDPPSAQDQQLIICANEGVGVVLTVEDADILGEGFSEHPISFTPISGPGHGILSGDWNTVIYRTGVAQLAITYVPDHHFVGEDEFAIKATDPYGEFVLIRVRVGVEACGPPPVEEAGVLPGPVVIHEIAWAGTPTRAEDQWIELMNFTDSPMDLTGWVLRWRKKVPETPQDLIWRVVELRGKIPARGFFLLERGHDEVVRDIPADLVYPERMVVGDEEIPLLFSLEGDVIELLDPLGHSVDRANADPKVNSWAAGAMFPPSSMERKSPHLPDLRENWWTNLGVTPVGTDAQGTPLLGTAKAPNEPEVLLLSKEPLVVERGPRVKLTRSTEERPSEAWGTVLRGDLAGGAGALVVKRMPVEIQWDELLGVAALTLDTTALEPGTYWIVVSFGQARFGVVPLVVR